MSLTHTFNLIGSMMKPVFDPGQGSGIPSGTDIVRTTTDGETAWDSSNLAVETKSWATARNTSPFAWSYAQNNLYLRMEKTANGMEINALTPDANLFPAEQDFYYPIATLPSAIQLFQNIEVKMYENNNVNFDAFKFVLTVREVDHNGSGIEAIPVDRLRAPGSTSTTQYPSDPQQVPWFSVTNTGDRAAYELFVGSFREGESDDAGQTQNAANRIVECWGRAQGYADTLLVTYTIQAYAEAVITN